jgi:hypothetical protein
MLRRGQTTSELNHQIMNYHLVNLKLRSTH